MAFKNKVVEFIIRGRDLLSGPAQDAEQNAAKLEQTIEILNTELKRTDAQKAAVSRYQELSKALVDNQQKYESASIKVTELAKKKKEAADASKSLAKDLANAEKALSELESQTTDAGGASDSLTRDITEQRNAVEALQREHKASVTSLANQDLALKGARSSMNQLASSLNKGRVEFDKLEKKLTRQKVDLNNLGEAHRKLTVTQQGTERAIASATSKLNKQKVALERTTKSASDYGGSIKGATRDLVAMAAAYVGIDQLAGSIKSIFETGDKFERLSVQMTGLMGGIAEGKKATAWVKEFTKNTPLQLSQVSQAFVKLKSFGIDPTNGAMQSIVDSAFKLGGGFEEVEGISLALGQAWAKQKLQGEEILQLIERGVPVWDMLERVTGKNVQELQKLSSAGKLGRDVIAALMDEMGRDSAGSAAAQMQLLSGQVSNAQDNLDQFYNMIAQSGAMDWLKQQITDLNKEFAAMATDGRLKAWAQSISDTIISIGESIKSGIATLVEYKDQILTVIKVWAALKVGTYFSNVISGAKSAILTLKTYTTGLKTVNTTTNAVAASSIKLKSILSSIGAIGVYTLLIDQLVNVFNEYQRLVKMENQVRDSQRKTEEQATRLANTFEEISREMGVNITTMEEYEAALKSGAVVWNEQLGIYENVAKKQKEQAEAASQAAEAERQRAEFLKLTVPEALKVIETLESQSHSLNGVRDGVDGFIQSLESARTALQGAGDEYSQQIVLIDKLRSRFEAHNESLERQAYLSDDLSAAYKKLGVESSEALKKSATELQGAFELIQQSNEPIALQRQAFLKWAEAAIEAAEATDQVVPASVKAASAALGLTNELDKLIAKANDLKPATDGNSEAVSRFAAELEKTRAAIENNQRILDSSTASAKQKQAAQEALNRQTGLVIQQENDLARVREAEKMTLQQLTVEQRKLEQELQKVGQSYQSGAISADEYQSKKERISQILSVVNDLLGDFKNAQDQVTAATQKGTEASKRHIESLQGQEKALLQVGESASLAAGKLESYWSSSAKQSGLGREQSGRPTVDTIVDYNEANPNAYYFSSREVQAEKARRDSAQLRDQQYSRFEREIKQAKSQSQLNDIYDKIFNQLNHLERDQRVALGELIKQQKEALKKAPTQSQAAHQSTQTQEYESPSTTRQNRKQDRFYPGKSSFQTGAKFATGGDLTGAVERLNETMERQYSGKTIRLVLATPGGQDAELYATVRDQLLDELERMGSVQ
ncbi:tape measure protein [Pseudoalteromonas sp. R3]|uniref:tape measure protein n=1 Tax=Pseudoalteromonas sp. R3 TaxID=1709477 RepID=UPI0006B635C5|nr:tape measure protein [Pseudoalteromonas sp. R3]AZZ98751.1 phage tail tape measure protein [Pseudoalteromonas sp. R3]